MPPHDISSLTIGIPDGRDSPKRGQLCEKFVGRWKMWDWVLRRESRVNFLLSMAAVDITIGAPGTRFNVCECSSTRDGANSGFGGN